MSQGLITTAPSGPATGAAAVSWRRDVDLRAIVLDGLDLLTVDVFDTLLVRRCGDMQRLYEAVERLARAAGALGEALPLHSFPAMRMQAEHLARAATLAQSGHRETTLAEIYRHWPAWLGNGAALHELEIAAERRNLTPNPYVVDLIADARRAGVAVWLVSDTWQPHAVLSDLLAGCGVPPSAYDRLAVSCEEGGSKEDGRLFTRIRQQTGTSPARWRHVGDNVEADVRMPAALGIAVTHYAAPPILRRIEAREALLAAPRSWRPDHRRRIAARDCGETGELAVWGDIGRYVIGPPIRAFCAAVARYSRDHQIRRIAPFLREGRILSELIESEAKRLGWAVDARPLAVSREALFLPAAPARIDRSALPRFGQSGVGHTVADVLRLFRLDDDPPPAVAAVIARIGEWALADVLADSGGKFLQLAEAIETPETQARLTATLSAARAVAVAYLTEALGDGGDVVTVDLGARGSTQAMLGRIAGVGDRYRFHHHLFYAVPPLLEHLSDGHRWFPFTGLAAAALDRAAVIYRSPQLLELALIGDLPTTIGYRWRDGGEGPAALPVTLPAAGDPTQAARLSACQQGVRHAAKIFAALDDASDDWRHGGGDEAEQALNAIYRLIQTPLREEAAAAATLHYDFNDGRRTARPLVDGLARQSLDALQGFHPASIPALAVSIRPAYCPWPQAVMTLDDPDALTRIHEATVPSLQHDAYVRLVIEYLQAQGVRRVIACAAGGLGGMGPAFIDRAQAAGMEIAGYLDYFTERVAGPAFHGAPVVTAASLPAAACRDFAVVSAGYAPQIAQVIDNALRDAAVPGRVWILPMHRK